jgi:hypothetical protein
MMFFPSSTMKNDYKPLSKKTLISRQTITKPADGIKDSFYKRKRSYDSGN